MFRSTVDRSIIGSIRDYNRTAPKMRIHRCQVADYLSRLYIASIPLVRSKYVECYRSRYRQRVVDQSSRATRGARPSSLLTLRGRRNSTDSFASSLARCWRVCAWKYTLRSTQSPVYISVRLYIIIRSSCHRSRAYVSLEFACLGSKSTTSSLEGNAKTNCPKAHIRFVNPQSTYACFL